LLHPGDRLPSPGTKFFEWETIKAFGCSVLEWERLPVATRAEMMAHEIHRAMRESWTAERLPKDGRGAASTRKVDAPWQGIMSQLGLPTNKKNGP
jgi:hypothetical protein